MNTQTRATWLSEMLQELGLALVTPDGPPVKFNDPPLQPFPPPERHPDSRQKTWIQHLSVWHLASRQ